jgi:hypothetical protein
MTPASSDLSRLALGLLLKFTINATWLGLGGTGVGLLSVALS